MSLSSKVIEPKEWVAGDKGNILKQSKLKLQCQRGKETVQFLLIAV